MTTIYKNYNTTDKRLLAGEIANSYIYGLLTPEASPSVAEGCKQHAKNIAALEQTLLVFNTTPGQHSLIVTISQRLGQERLWLKHYDKCLLEFNRARVDMTAKLKPETKKKKGFWATLFSDDETPVLDPKEKRRRDLAKARMDALAIEVRSLTEAEAVVEAATDAQAKAKKAEEDKRKQEENKKKQGEHQRSPTDHARESRRRFLMEDDKPNENQKRDEQKEKAST